MHYRNEGYEDFSAELQGARVRRMLGMTGKVNSKWTSKMIGQIISKDGSVTRRKLMDQIGWSVREIELLAKATEIPFDRLYVLDNKSRVKRWHAQNPVHLPQVIGDAKLLNYFVGAQLDSRSRDSIVKHLSKIEQWVARNKVKIRKRRNKERELRRKREMVKFIFAKLHEETGVWPYELIRIRKKHGNFAQFQERFDQLKEKFKNWKPPKA